MKRSGLVCGAAVLMLAVGAGQAFGQAGGGGGGGGGRAGRGGAGAGGQGGQGGGQMGRGGMGGAGGMRANNLYANQYALMEANLKLTDEQKPKIKTKVDAMNAELDTFDTTAQEAVRGARAGGGGGGRGGRGGQAIVGGADALGDRVRGLISDYEKLVAKHQASIDAELTPEQKISWETFKLDRSLEGRILVMGLSGDQRTKLKEMTAAAGKAIAELPDLTDVAAIEDVEGKLSKRIIAEVLTDGQASMLMGGEPLPPVLQMAGRAGGPGGGFGGQGAGQGGGQGGGRGGRGRGGAGAAGGAGGNAAQGAVGADGMPATRVDRLP